MKSLHNQVRNHLQDRVRHQIHTEVWYHVHYRVLLPVWDQYHGLTRDEIYDQIIEECLDA